MRPNDQIDEASLKGGAGAPFPFQQKPYILKPYAGLDVQTLKTRRNKATESKDRTYDYPDFKTQTYVKGEQPGDSDNPDGDGHTVDGDWPRGSSRGAADLSAQLSRLGLSVDALLALFPDDDAADVLESLHQLGRVLRQPPILIERTAFYVSLIRSLPISERRQWLDALTDVRLHLVPSEETLAFLDERDVPDQLERWLFGLVGLEPPESHDEDRDPVTYTRALVTFLEMWRTLLATDANVALLLRILSKYPHLQAYYADDFATRNTVLRMAEVGFDVDHLVFGRSEVGSAGASLDQPDSWSEHLMDVLRRLLGRKESPPEVPVWPNPGKIYHELRDDIERVREDDENAGLRVIDRVLPQLESRYEQLRQHGRFRKASRVEESVQNLRYLRSVLSGDLERVDEPVRLRARRSPKHVPELFFDNVRFACCLFKPAGLFHGEISRLLLDPATPLIEYVLDPYPDFMGLATLYAGIDAQRHPTLLVDTVDYDDRLLDLRGNNGTLRFVLNTIVVDAKLAGAERVAVFVAPYGKPVNFANFVKEQAEKSDALTYHERYYFEGADPSDAALNVSLTGGHHYTTAFGYLRPLLGVIQYGHNLVGPGKVLPYPDGGEGVVEIDVDAFIAEKELEDEIPETDAPITTVDDVAVWRRPAWHDDEIKARLGRADARAKRRLAGIDETLTLEVHAPPSPDLVETLLAVDRESFDQSLQYGPDDLDVRLRWRDATVLLVRSEAGDPFAFALGYVSPVLGPNAFYLDTLAVVPDAQNRGLGDILTEYMAYRAMLLGFHRLYTLAETGPEDDLWRFYTDNDFRPVGQYKTLGALFVRSLHVADVLARERIDALLGAAAESLSAELEDVDVHLYTTADEELIGVMRDLELVFPPEQRYSEAEFRQRLSYPDAQVFVVTVGGEPVGFSIGYADPSLPTHAIFLDSMGVRPAVQRNGIGTTLFEVMRQVPALSHYTQAVFYCGDDLVEYYQERGARFVDVVEGKNRMQIDLRADDLLPAEITEQEQAPGEETEPESNLQRVKGIGPSYADRLRAVGVETLSDLATADPAAAAEIDVSEERFEEWRERARRLLGER